MKGILFVLIFLVYLPINMFAQKEANIWYFGSYHGLDFNTTPPTILRDSKLYSVEGSGSMADTSGNLLFYSDGYLVNNKKHRVMENGDGLNGKFSGSSSSAALGVRVPLSYRYYYIFTSDQVNGVSVGYPDHGTCYSIIDMQGDSGRGKVIVKKQVLVSGSAEKIAAVVHANKKDVWIAVKQNYSDTLFLFLLTEKGLSPKIIKHITYKDSVSLGQIKFSPNGKYIAMANSSVNSKRNALYIYNFDNKTGNISNERKITSKTVAIEFSPNSKLLYWTSGKFINNKIEHRLYQARIKDINTFVGSDSMFYFKRDFRASHLQLAPNKKIYAAEYDTFLNVIDFPNGLDSNCKIVLRGQKILSSVGFYGTNGFPSFVASYFKSEEFTFKSSCINEPTRILLIDSLDNDSIKWDFGDTASGINNFSIKTKEITHTYKNYGDYTITLVSYYDNRADTVTQNVSFKNPKPDFMANDVCENDSVHFSNKSSDLVGKLTFQWKFGDGETSNHPSPAYLFTINNVSRTFNVSLSTMMDNGCKDSITKQVTINANPDSDFSFSIIKNAADFKANQPGNTSYKWFFGNGDSASVAYINYNYVKLGKYTCCLKVTNAAGCSSKTCKDVSIIVGIQSIDKPKGFKIYPNPNTGTFTLEIENPEQDVSIQVLDILGQIVHSNEKAKSSITIDLKNGAGLYFVKVFIGGIVYNQKVVVINGYNQ